jgi:hypothetical protein
MEWLLRTWDDVCDIGVNPGFDSLFGLQSLLFLPLGSTLRLELAFLLFGQLSLPLLMCLRARFRQGSPSRLNRITTT